MSWGGAMTRGLLEFVGIGRLICARSENNRIGSAVDTERFLTITRLKPRIATPATSLFRWGRCRTDGQRSNTRLSRRGHLDRAILLFQLCFPRRQL